MKQIEQHFDYVGNSADIDSRPVYTRRELRRLHRLNFPRKHLTLRGFDFFTALVIRVTLIVLVIGFVYYMNARPFDFHSLAEGMFTHNFTVNGFDYQGAVDEINAIFDKIKIDDPSIPPWVSNLANGVIDFILGFRYICILLVSLFYVIGWILGFFWYILTLP